MFFVSQKFFSGELFSLVSHMVGQHIRSIDVCCGIRFISHMDKSAKKNINRLTDLIILNGHHFLFGHFTTMTFSCCFFLLRMSFGLILHNP